METFVKRRAALLAFARIYIFYVEVFIYYEMRRPCASFFVLKTAHCDGLILADLYLKDICSLVVLHNT